MSPSPCIGVTDLMPGMSGTALARAVLPAAICPVTHRPGYAEVESVPADLPRLANALGATISQRQSRTSYWLSPGHWGVASQPTPQGPSLPLASKASAFPSSHLLFHGQSRFGLGAPQARLRRNWARHAALPRDRWRGAVEKDGTAAPDARMTTAEWLLIQIFHLEAAGEKLRAFAKRLGKPIRPRAVRQDRRCLNYSTGCA
jgi:hypothetical protein